MIENAFISTLEGFTRREFDIFVNVTGYERRASTLLEAGCVEARQVYSLRFASQQELSFSHNLRIMNLHDAEFVDAPYRFFRERFPQVVGELSKQLGRELRIGIDVSSMNRTMIASSLLALRECHSNVCNAEILYLPAKFKAPRFEFDIEQVGPAIPELSGFDSDPTLPVGLLLGVGYEYGVALGLLNSIEPRWTLCFKASGQDSRYEDAVRDANMNFDFGSQTVDVVDYPLHDPRAAFQYIENIAYGMLTNYRVIIVPMGPKIFATIAILLALQHFGQIAVWRVASLIKPEEAAPQGTIVGFELNTASFGLGAEGVTSLTRSRGA